MVPVGCVEHSFFAVSGLWQHNMSIESNPGSHLRADQSVPDTHPSRAISNATSAPRQRFRSFGREPLLMVRCQKVLFQDCIHNASLQTSRSALILLAILYVVADTGTFMLGGTHDLVGRLNIKFNAKDFLTAAMGIKGR